MFCGEPLTWLDRSPNLERLSMFYVICPTCEARVEVPANAVGPHRTDPWNVIACDECDTGFDYDDDEIITEPEPTDWAE